MWEEGACIYGTPGVPNNFPMNSIKKCNESMNNTNKNKLNSKISWQNISYSNGHIVSIVVGLN